MNLPRLLIIIALMLLLFGATGKAQATDVYGQVRIYNGTCYSGIGMNGIKVLLYDNAGFLDSCTTYTDEAFMAAHNLTSPLGIYYFDDVPYSEDYTVEVIPALGTQLTPPPPGEPPTWNANPRQIGTNFYRCFLVDIVGDNFEPRTIGYWKHQCNVAVKGHGNAQVPEEELIVYLNMIYTLFDNGAYFPIEGVSSVGSAALTPDDALNTFKLSNGGPIGMVHKAKKQLLALLLNVTAEYVYVYQEISADDRTISEAIAFGADMITNGGSELEMAKDVMDMINNGETVPAGWIPDYGLVYYGDEGDGSIAAQMLPTTAVIVGNYPNPFNPETRISFTLPEAARVSLTIFNLQGRQIGQLVSGDFSAGLHEVNWNAADYPSGAYIYRLSGDFGAVSGKMLLVK